MVRTGQEKESSVSVPGRLYPSSTPHPKVTFETEINLEREDSGRLYLFYAQANLIKHFVFFFFLSPRSISGHLYKLGTF